MNLIKAGYNILTIIAISDGEMDQLEADLIVDFLAKYQNIDFDIESENKEIKKSLNNGTIEERVVTFANYIKNNTSRKDQLDMLDFVYQLIVADGKIVLNEFSLFSILCEHWEVDCSKYMEDNIKNSVQAGYNILMILAIIDGKINDIETDYIISFLQKRYSGEFDIVKENDIIDRYNQNNNLVKRVKEAALFLKDCLNKDDLIEIFEFSYDMIQNNGLLTDKEFQIFNYLSEIWCVDLNINENSIEFSSLDQSAYNILLILTLSAPPLKESCSILDYLDGNIIKNLDIEVENREINIDIENGDIDNRFINALKYYKNNSDQSMRKNMISLIKKIFPNNFENDKFFIDSLNLIKILYKYWDIDS